MRAALRDLEDEVPRDERRGPPVLEVVHRVAIRPSDLVDVAESARRHDRDTRAGSREQRVDAERRAVDEEVEARELRARLREPRDHSAGRVRRNRLDLLVPEAVPVVAEQHDVRERSSDVDRDPHASTSPARLPPDAAFSSSSGT